MTPTEKMVQEINGFFAAIGEDKLALPAGHERLSELELLRRVKEEYTQRLIRQFPAYRLLPSRLIPDLFLQALRNREAELEE